MSCKNSGVCIALQVVSPRVFKCLTLSLSLSLRQHQHQHQRQRQPPSAV